MWKWLFHYECRMNDGNNAFQPVELLLEADSIRLQTDLTRSKSLCFSWNIGDIELYWIVASISWITLCRLKINRFIDFALNEWRFSSIFSLILHWIIHPPPHMKYIHQRPTTYKYVYRVYISLLFCVLFYTHSHLLVALVVYNNNTMHHHIS